MQIRGTLPDSNRPRKEFESDLFSDICSLLGISSSRTTPCHPQSDGKIERFNRILQQMLAIFVDQNKKTGMTTYNVW